MDFLPGQPITWLHVPRGGYGYTFPVDGTVVKVGPKTLTISVQLRDGATVERRVKRENVRHRV